MTRIPSPFGGGTADGPLFDEYDEFVPEHLPEPGPFLADHDVLTDEEYVAFHECTRDVFEERTVYDATFGYNLARLNLDTRHTGAGYRYAEERDDPAVLRAEFTPTTAFCPQTHSLTIGSFRAWNGLADRHSYDLVRVRSAPMHHQSEAVNDQLEALEERYQTEGELPDGPSEELGANALEGSGGTGGSSGGSGSPF